ncbi:hypothetical protein K2O51_31830 (plasmid) [Cupriavidus pinatubonensis]|uniref:hypothetical protein n=1 Tax=Cupriavidus pinatubonensis TaxID=248026 RepID=UPI001C73C9C3|nr:hypothetical protein [Cupriavidus pinatubonensis]QYY33617.1 hypothetical protein K2O51_31830 [Cupriavidus pinatubonensis]
MNALLVGIKRRLQTAGAKSPDAAIAAAEDKATAAANFTCCVCGFRSKSTTEVLHLNGNHDDISARNLSGVCALCHPYHHIGERTPAARSQGEKVAHQTRLMRVPTVADGGISAGDLNHLFRAIACALNDPGERENALKVLQVINEATVFAKASWGTASPRDFHAAMLALSDSEYAHRGEAVEDLRLAFHEHLLTAIGSKLQAEQSGLPVANWTELLARTLVKLESHAPADAEAAQ